MPKREAGRLARCSISAWATVRSIRRWNDAAHTTPRPLVVPSVRTRGTVPHADVGGLDLAAITAVDAHAGGHHSARSGDAEAPGHLVAQCGATAGGLAHRVLVDQTGDGAPQLDFDRSGKQRRVAWSRLELELLK
jgi:hypothetical protein